MYSINTFRRKLSVSQQKSASPDANRPTYTTLPQRRIVSMEATIFTGWIYDYLHPHAEKVKVLERLREWCIFDGMNLEPRLR